MERIGYEKSRLTGGFWKEKQELIRSVTVHAVYDRFKETGRFDAFRFDKSSPIKPHFFWDSDVAKWIEGVAYITAEKRDAELEGIVDALVDLIEKNQDTCGYFNIYHTVVEPENRFKNRDNHELYCLGHFIEAAVAYYQATGKKKLLDLMLKYVDYVEERFVIKKDAAFTTPGHEEIELALVRLYELTGEEKHLRLAEFFVNERGKRNEDGKIWYKPCYNQSHMPVREQKTAQGHAVRAVYLYSAMADLAKKCGDVSLKEACEKIFDDIVTKKMYITGGIGSSNISEAFTVDYDLSNLVAYNESCAAIGLILFAHRMLLIDNNSKYSDVIERVLYNGFLSSVSLDGKSFFYTNPLQIIPYLYKRNVSSFDPQEYLPPSQRQEVFGCSCCPPNIVRFIPSIANIMYTHDDNTVYVHQFMSAKTHFTLTGKDITLVQETDYPNNGKIKITVTGADIRLGIRIPEWCDSFEGETVNGYAYFNVKDGESVSLDFKMKPVFIEANPRAVFDCGRCAVQRGPVVYCMEGCDNEGVLSDIRLDSSAEFTEGFNTEINVPTLSIDAYKRKESAALYSKKSNSLEKIKATLIPYYAFANRGENEMQVWTLIKE